MGATYLTSRTGAQFLPKTAPGRGILQSEQQEGSPKTQDHHHARASGQGGLEAMYCRVGERANERRGLWLTGRGVYEAWEAEGCMQADSKKAWLTGADERRGRGRGTGNVGARARQPGVGAIYHGRDGRGMAPVWRGLACTAMLNEVMSWAASAAGGSGAERAAGATTKKVARR
jgi:hypothetical protein